MEAVQRVKRKEAAVVEKKNAMEEARLDIEERQKEGVEAEKECARIEKKRDKELAKGGKLKALEEELSNFVKELTKLATQAEIKEGTITDEGKKVDGLQRALEQVSICPLKSTFLLIHFACAITAAEFT